MSKPRTPTRRSWWPYLWPALLCALAALLVLPRLGQRPLWGDEADTALHALSVLRTGLPQVYSDRWVISYWQLTSSDSLLQDRVPWLSFYATAGSFAVFGPSAWSARFPFALAAIACVPCLYFFSRRLCGDERVAVLAALLCGTSVSFLLYARQCRYYEFVLLFTLLACWASLDVSVRRPSSILLFVLPSVLLFYSNQLSAVSFMAAAAVSVLVFERHRDKLIGFALAAATVALLALPWLIFSSRGVGSEIGRAAGVIGRLDTALRLSLLYFRDYAGVGFFPVLMVPLLAAAVIRWRALRGPILRLALIVVVMTAVTSLLYFQAANPGWDFRSSIRHQIGLLPLMAVLMAVCCALVARWRRLAAAALVILLIGTNLLWQPVDALRWRKQWRSATAGLVSGWSPLANYLYEITHDVVDPSAVVTDYLDEHAEANDLVLVAPPWMSDTLAFGTSAPLRYCSPPQRDYAPREAALRKLPRYLVDPGDELDWFVDFHGAYGLFRDFVPHVMGLPFPGETDRPELWWHAFKTIGPEPGDHFPVVYQKPR